MSNAVGEVLWLSASTGSAHMPTVPVNQVNWQTVQSKYEASGVEQDGDKGGS